MSLGEDFWKGTMGKFFEAVWEYGETIGIGCGIIQYEYDTCHGECCYIKDTQQCCFWCEDVGICEEACLLIRREVVK